MCSRHDSPRPRFDFLAAALENDYRAVCPTLLEGGDSDWLPIKEDYDYLHYCTHMAALIAQVSAMPSRWIGWAHLWSA